MSETSVYSLALPKLPLLTLGKFDADDFHDWMHTAQRFFVQYKLWDIVTGDLANPARDVEPSVTSGKIDLGDNAGPRAGGRFLRRTLHPDRPHETSIYQ